MTTQPSSAGSVDLQNCVYILLSALRDFEEAVGEKYDDEGGDVAAIEREFHAGTLGVAQAAPQPGKWSLHRQPADQIADHEYSIWLGEEPVIMANAMPGCSKYLNLLVDTLNAHPTQGGDKGEAVAWRWLDQYGDEHCTSTSEFARLVAAVGVGVEPLYATPQPVLYAVQAAMDDQRDPDATRALRMEQFDEDRPSPASSEAMLAKVSPLKFKTAEDRDAFAKRLNGHAYYMIRSRDQGHDGRIGVTDELIDDLRAAAAIVACSEVCTKSPTS